MTRQNQTQGLFKPEVYEAMQRRLQGSSAYRGAEEAFDMFYADRRLQNFLRAYAKKEDIKESKGLEFTQAGEDRKIHLVGPTNKHYDFWIQDAPHLFIGPRQNGDSALVVYARDEDLYYSEHPSPRSFRLGELKKIKGIWRISVPEQIAQDGVGYVSKTTYRVSQVPLFQKAIDKRDILTGLERAIEELIRKK
jgi:hypothetical protein